MEFKDKQLEVARMLEQHELGLSQLYGACADQLPEHEDFWRRIAEEERAHASVVKTFRLLIEDEALGYDPRPFKLKAIESAIQKLDEHLDHARRNELRMIDALETAMAVEFGLLEKNIFRPRDGDHQELKKMLATLHDDTREHYGRIKKVYDQLCGGGFEE